MPQRHSFPSLNSPRRPSARTAIVLCAIITLAPGLLSAQPFPDKRAPAGSESSRVPPDAEIIARPPDSVDSKLARPVPRGKDPGLIERPPTNDLPGERRQPIDTPSLPPPSRKDCKGTASAEACAQDPAS